MSAIVVSAMANPFILQSVGGFQFGSREPLDTAGIHEIIAILRKTLPSQKEVLGGRSSLVRANFSGLGAAVVKTYHRGGVISRLISHRYIRYGKPRCQIEFEFFERARACGIAVPEPLAFITQGGVLYRSWFMSKEIVGAHSLAYLAVHAPERLPHAIERVSKLVQVLIHERIFHVDLHPGNVLVSPSGECYVIDFDKARVFSGTLSHLREKYLCRWRRAVIKHELPELLSELLCAQVRTKMKPV